MTRINESIICAGSGGQGVMLLGKFLANAGMTLGLNVTWFPSYGAEVRGGTAHSFIRISSSAIASPVVYLPGTAIIMNRPSLDKFENSLVPGGLLILNVSMCGQRPERDDIDIVEAPLTEEAVKLGNIKVANMIAAGIYAARKKIFDKELMVSIIEKMAGTRKELVPVNVKAIEKGMEIAGSQDGG
ncbi:MAG: 2-oxoacid:acceptor oxidoreductase family protein [Candidatus Omnitrophica bacterium]|nr:2-oxoacid:acceptor oxidoreductase family protein [Candidatus Omnitrophota bacterium]